MEVEDLLFVLENMSKGDVSISAYQNAREDMEGYMFEIKQLHASFRHEAAENDLLQHAKFLEDSKELVKWQMEQWNRLDRLKPKGYANAIKQSNPTPSTAAQASCMQDTIQTLHAALRAIMMIVLKMKI